MVMELLFWFAVYCPCHHNPPCFFCGCCGTECSSAVNANIPVSTSSGCLYSQGIDDNEVTFAFPLEDPQMQNKEPNISKPTSDVGCQVNTRGLQLMMKSSETQTYRSSFEVILCDQSTQTDESFHEEVESSKSPEDPPPPPKKKSPKKFHHLVKIHLTYHQDMVNCQKTQTTYFT